MLLLSSGFVSLLQSFAPLFDSRVWSYAQLLLVGAILAPGKRTVTSVLRIVGRGNEQCFQNYHRVLNRARWNSHAAKSFHTKNGTVTPPCCVVAGAGRRSLRPPHRWLTTGSAAARAASSTGSHRLLSHGSACVGDCALLDHARHRRCARPGSTGHNRWPETPARSGDARPASTPPFWLC